MAHAPHPDFKALEASRPAWEASSTFHFTQTANPSWTFGRGASAAAGSGQKHVAIDPYGDGRPAVANYKLLISAVVPRPVAFVSTRSADGTTENLAPFSYFQLVNHDPPLFVVGFATPMHAPRDTLRNLADTRECVINIISEDFLEAANSTSVNAPYGTSEWAVSGLTPVCDCLHVGCARVRESVFSIEGRLESLREFDSRAAPGKKSGTLAVIEGLNFWAREDAINDERNMIDPAILQPISRLGGITYGRTTQAVEITRPDFQRDLGGQEAYEKLLETQQQQASKPGESETS